MPKHLKCVHVDDAELGERSKSCLSAVEYLRKMALDINFTHTSGDSFLSVGLEVRGAVRPVAVHAGSGPSQGHTDWPFDYEAKPGVASVLPKAWGPRTNPEGGRYWGQLLEGKLKVEPGGELRIFLGRSLGVGFWPVLVGVTLLVDSVSSLPFGKGEKVIHPWDMAKNSPVCFERLPQGKDVDSVAICARGNVVFFLTTVFSFRIRICFAFVFLVRLLARLVRSSASLAIVLGLAAVELLLVGRKEGLPVSSDLSVLELLGRRRLLPRDHGRLLARELTKLLWWRVVQLPVSELKCLSWTELSTA